MLKHAPGAREVRIILSADKTTVLVNLDAGKVEVGPNKFLASPAGWRTKDFPASAPVDQLLCNAYLGDCRSWNTATV